MTSITPPPTWVLLRGLAREARHWGDLPERLAAAAPGSRVLAIDLPGAGRAHGLRSPWSVQGIVRQVRATLAAEGAPPPYAVLAMSLGGMVATAWAHAWPGEIDTAVLVNTSLRPFSPPWQRLRPAAAGALLRTFGAPAADAERAILRLTSRNRADDAELAAHWACLRTEHPMRARDVLAQLTAAARFRAPRHNPFARALLLAGACDALVDPRCSAAIAAAWGCGWRRHPHAGHDLALDDPGWIVAHASTFQRARSPGTSRGHPGEIA